MTRKVLEVLVIVLVKMAIGDLQTFYLQKPCRSRQLDLEPYSLGAGLVEVTDDKGLYKDYLQCSLTIRAAKGDKLMIRILRLDVEFSNTCTSDYLQIIDGTVLENRTLDGITYYWRTGRICGTQTYDNTYVSTTNYVTINFTSDGLTHYTGFTLMFTTFHTGECKSDEFQCDNLRCIDGALQCTQHDNCGDGSNVCEAEDDTTIVIAVVVAVVLVLVVLIMFTIRTVRTKTITELQNGSEMTPQNDANPTNKDPLEKPLLASECYQSIQGTVSVPAVQDVHV